MFRSTNIPNSRSKTLTDVLCQVSTRYVEKRMSHTHGGAKCVPRERESNVRYLAYGVTRKSDRRARVESGWVTDTKAPPERWEGIVHAWESVHATYLSVKVWCYEWPIVQPLDQRHWQLCDDKCQDNRRQKRSYARRIFQRMLRVYGRTWWSWYTNGSTRARQHKRPSAALMVGA